MLKRMDVSLNDKMEEMDTDIAYHNTYRLKVSKVNVLQQSPNPSYGPTTDSFGKYLDI